MPKHEDFKETGYMEVFRAGDYGTKGSFTTSDLDEIVESFNAGGHVPPVVIGHPSDDDIRKNELADGKVTGVRRSGDVLEARADISNEEHRKWWEQNRLLGWSISVYKNFEGTGKKALRHLGALGKTPPHIKGLNYKPTFAADEKAGEVIDFDMKPESTNGGNHMGTLEELQAENARLKQQAAVAEQKASTAAEFAETAEKQTAELAKVRKEKDTAEAALKTEQADREDEKREASFAEIEDLTKKAHEAGLPKTHGDSFRTILAAERGLNDDDGTVQFAEGKTGKYTEAAAAMRDAKWVPMDKESGSKRKSESGAVDFDETDLDACQAKRMETADKMVEDKEVESFEEAHSKVLVAHPEWYPEYKQT